MLRRPGTVTQYERINSAHAQPLVVTTVSPPRQVSEIHGANRTVATPVATPNTAPARPYIANETSPRVPKRRAGHAVAKEQSGSPARSRTAWTRCRLYIDGEFVDSTADEWFESVDPYTNEPCIRVPRAGRTTWTTRRTRPSPTNHVVRLRPRGRERPSERTRPV